MQTLLCKDESPAIFFEAHEEQSKLVRIAWDLLHFGATDSGVWGFADDQLARRLVLGLLKNREEIPAKRLGRHRSICNEFARLFDCLA